MLTLSLARNRRELGKWLGLVLGLEGGAISLNKVESQFEFSYRSWWLKKTIDKDPILQGSPAPFTSKPSPAAARLGT